MPARNKRETRREKKKSPVDQKCVNEVRDTEESHVIVGISKNNWPGTQAALIQLLKEWKDDQAPEIFLIGSAAMFRLSAKLREVFWRGVLHCVRYRDSHPVFESRDVSAEYRHLSRSGSTSKVNTKSVVLTAGFNEMLFILYQSLRLWRAYPNLCPIRAMTFVHQFYGKISQHFLMLYDLGVQNQFRIFCLEREEMVDVNPSVNNNVSSLRQFFSWIAYYVSLFPAVGELLARYPSFEELSEAYRPKTDRLTGLKRIDGSDFMFLERFAHAKEYNEVALAFSVQCGQVVFVEKFEDRWDVVFHCIGNLRELLIAGVSRIVRPEMVDRYIEEIKKLTATKGTRFRLMFMGKDLLRLKNYIQHMRRNTGLVSPDQVARYSELIGPVATPPACFPARESLSLAVPVPPLAPVPSVRELSVFAKGDRQWVGTAALPQPQTAAL